MYKKGNLQDVACSSRMLSAAAEEFGPVVFTATLAAQLGAAACGVAGVLAACSAALLH